MPRPPRSRNHRPRTSPNRCGPNAAAGGSGSSESPVLGMRGEASLAVFSTEERQRAMNIATPIVFVVDDDVSVRESLELLIRAEGWRAETFASAREFETRPRAAVPSCLLLDVTLPDINGLELQKRVAAE